MLAIYAIWRRQSLWGTYW
ncbi:UNVERIFIED_CONTAM: hypothetical protein GTU68_037836 [Idotea baltica]|nr:hypothetical protein [Idotea baltica]